MLALITYWPTWMRTIAIALAIVAFVDAFILAFKARAPVSILTWGTCTLLATCYFIVFSLYSLGWINSQEYVERISPLIFPVYLTIWVLPPLEWSWRLRQANNMKDKHDHQSK